MPDSPQLPQFVNWPSFPFEGQLRTKRLDAPVPVEPPREGEDPNTCTACKAPDERYVWVSDRWRVRAMERPSGLPMVLILESRSHLDLGDLPNLHAAELGVMTVRIERAIRSLDEVERVHVNRWGDGAAHFHQWFLGRPTGYLQLRGSFLSQWDDILEPIPEARWRENLAHVAAWLADFGGRAIAEPPRIEWHTPSRFGDVDVVNADEAEVAAQAGSATEAENAAQTENGGQSETGVSAQAQADGVGQTSGAGQANDASQLSTAGQAGGGATATSIGGDNAAATRDDAKADSFSAFSSPAKTTAPAQRKPADDVAPSGKAPTASGTAPVLTVPPATTARGTATVVSQQVVEPPTGSSEPDWTISEEELESSDILAR